MTQPPQDPQNPWENPGGGNPPQQPPGPPPNQPPPGSSGPSFGKEQPGPYGGQGPYGSTPPPGQTGYGAGGVPPYSGGQDAYGQQYGGAPRIASKWKRLAAIIIDGLIFAVVFCCVSLPFTNRNNNSYWMTNNGDSTKITVINTGAPLVLGLVAALVTFLYFYFLTYQWNGQTLGKKALSIRVVRADDGGPVTSQMAMIRAAVYAGFGLLGAISSCLGLLGLVDAIWIFTNPRNQTLHDRFAKTVVVDAVGPNPYQRGGNPQSY